MRIFAGSNVILKGYSLRGAASGRVIAGETRWLSDEAEHPLFQDQPDAAALNAFREKISETHAVKHD